MGWLTGFEPATTGITIRDEEFLHRKIKLSRNPRDRFNPVQSGQKPAHFRDKTGDSPSQYNIVARGVDKWFRPPAKIGAVR